MHGFNGSEYVCVSWSGAPVVAVCAEGQEQFFRE